MRAASSSCSAVGLRESGGGGGGAGLERRGLPVDASPEAKDAPRLRGVTGGMLVESSLSMDSVRSYAPVRKPPVCPSTNRAIMSNSRVLGNTSSMRFFW